MIHLWILQVILGITRLYCFVTFIKRPPLAKLLFRLRYDFLVVRYFIKCALTWKIYISSLQQFHTHHKRSIVAQALGNYHKLRGENSRRPRRMTGNRKHHREAFTARKREGIMWISQGEKLAAIARSEIQNLCEHFLYFICFVLISLSHLYRSLEGWVNIWIQTLYFMCKERAIWITKNGCVWCLTHTLSPIS